MLLERETQLSGLTNALAGAAEHSGGLVLVPGEAGSGKSSLIRAFVQSLDDSVLVIEGACDPLATPRPLSPLYDFAADPDSGLSELVAGDREPMVIFHELLDRLRNTIRPIVLVIEDVHWADEATLDLLRFLGRRIGDTRTVLICTYRDDEVGPDHPVRPVLGQLIPLGTTRRLAVGALSRDAVTRMAADQDVDLDQLYRLTDGNAFFVTEVLASGIGLPETVQEAVLTRVAMLAPGPRRVVEGVSAAPRSLELDQATALAGATVSDVDDALSAGVLVGDGRNLRFRHELARSAVEESLSVARRLDLHRRMLGLLSEEKKADLARLAHHAMCAGEIELTLQYAPAAAREAVARAARKEAIAFYRGALEHSEMLDPRAEADIRRELAEQLAITGEPSASVDEHRQAVELYRQLGDSLSLADSLVHLMVALWRVNEAAEAEYQEAYSILATMEPSIECVNLYYAKGHLEMLARHGTAAFESLRRGREIAAQVDELEDFPWRMKMLEGTVHIVLGEPMEGLRILSECAEEGERTGNSRHVLISLGMLGSGGGEARVYEPALSALERSIQIGLATDADYSVAYDRSWLARIAFEQGRWDEAVRWAELVNRTSPDQIGISVLTARSALGRVRVRRGDPGGVELLEEMIELGLAHEIQHAWNAICGYGEFHWLRDRDANAPEILLDGFRRALDTESEWARGELGFWMWRMGAIDGPPENCAEPFQKQMSGDWQGAATAWRQIGCPYEVALALSDGDIESKMEALETFDRLGAGPAAAMVRRSLRDSGIDHIPRGPAATTLDNPYGMTKRQMEVYRLLTEGLSNGEIAEQLFLAKKTVEHHVSAIYSKLGVTTRSQAMAIHRDVLTN